MKKQNTVAMQMFRITFVFYLLINIILTIVQMKIEWDRTKKLVQDNLYNIGNATKDSMTYAFWNLSYEQMKTYAVGLLSIPVVCGVEYYDDSFTNYCGIKGDIYQVFDLNFKSGNKELKLGEMKIYSSSKYIFNSLKVTYAMMILNTVIIIMLFWALIVILSHNIISKPLGKLVKLTSEVSLDNLAYYRNINIISKKNNNEITALQDSFNRMIENLYNAKKAERYSEEKYRILAEGSKDGICSIDYNGKILIANNELCSLFGVSLIEITKKNILDFLDDENDYQHYNEAIFREKLLNIISGKEISEFKMRFKNISNGESREYDVKLSKLKDNVYKEIDEIIVRLSYSKDNEYLKYFVSESQYFKIPNTFSAAKAIVDRSVLYLPKYLKEDLVTQVKVCLIEIVMNAIEHGNLKITYQEKTDALMEGRYFDLLAERQKYSDAKNKLVSIKYTINEDYAEFIITDEGEGFDYSSIMKKIEEDKDSLSLHGRGIRLTLSFFDKVEYNDRGNQVRLYLDIKKKNSELK